MKWLRRITSKPIRNVDLGITQEELDAWLFDPDLRDVSIVEQAHHATPQG